jgi:hypothetical protein
MSRSLPALFRHSYAVFSYGRVIVIERLEIAFQTNLCSKTTFRNISRRKGFSFFIIYALLIMFIAVITVSYQSISAATTNR